MLSRQSIFSNTNKFVIKMETGTISNPEKVFVNKDTVRYLKYFDSTQTLEINFDSDSLYRYEGVGREVFEAFVKAQDKRGFFEREVYDRFPFKKLR